MGGMGILVLLVVATVLVIGLVVLLGMSGKKKR